MSRGLDSFDRFDWPSLLAGRDILLCAARHAEALTIAEGLEAAGARVTIAEDQGRALDRLARRRFAIVVQVLDGTDEPSPGFSAAIRDHGARLVLLAEKDRQAALHSAHPEAQLAERKISQRALVHLLVGTSDE